MGGSKKGLTNYKTLCRVEYKMPPFWRNYDARQNRATAHTAATQKKEGDLRD